MRLALGLIFWFAIAGAAAIFIADHPGSVRLEGADWRIEASLGALGLGLLSFAVGLIAVGRLWAWLKSGHPLSPQQRRFRRHRAGIVDLDQAMVALAAGEPRRARRLATRAALRLEDSAVAQVIAAQAASRDGDDAAAHRHFAALSHHQQGRFLGLRGEVGAARSRGDVAAALALIDQARTIEPDSPWAISTAFDIETAAAAWDRAEATLKRAVRLQVIDAKTAIRQRGVLRYCQALAAHAANDDDRALKLTLAAHKLLPDFAPATALAARLLRQAGNSRRAQAVIEAGWRRLPHPRLAEVYAGLYPAETATARLKRFERLAAQNPRHRQSLLHLSEAALGAGETERARGLLLPLLDQPAERRRSRLAAIMVEIETALGNPDHRAQWTEIVETGDAEPLWRCRSCSAERARWSAHCPACGQFDGLEWDRPVPPANQLTQPAEMILLPGEDKSI